MAVAQSRRTHCPREHPYDVENTYYTGDGKRLCRTCSLARWRAGHVPRTFVEMVWARIERDAASGCWLWVGSRATNGYGRWSNLLAHRLVYELLVEPIPVGLVLDHLCRVRPCVNPAHLEVVTLAENVRRGAESRRREGVVPPCV